MCLKYLIYLNNSCKWPSLISKTWSFKAKHELSGSVCTFREVLSKEQMEKMEMDGTSKKISILQRSQLLGAQNLRDQSSCTVNGTIVSARRVSGFSSGLCAQVEVSACRKIIFQSKVEFGLLWKMWETSRCNASPPLFLFFVTSWLVLKSICSTFFSGVCGSSWWKEKKVREAKQNADSGNSHNTKANVSRRLALLCKY